MSHILKGTSSDTPDHEDTETLVIEDWYALFHSIVSVQETFKTISECILQKLPKNADVIFRMEGTILLFDTGKGNRRRVINISEIALSYSEQYRSSLWDSTPSVAVTQPAHLRVKGMLDLSRLSKSFQSLWKL